MPDSILQPVDIEPPVLATASHTLGNLLALRSSTPKKF